MNLLDLETKYITALRFIKTKKQLPLTEVNIFNEHLIESLSKLQKPKKVSRWI